MFIKGISFGFMGPAGYYRGPVGVREAERICETGVSWVALIVTVVQERYSSTRMFSDFHYTPADGELAEVVAKFKRHNIKIMLKPMIECLDSIWRGNIRFPAKQMMIQGIEVDYWGEWFAHYADMIGHYAALAEELKLDLFCVGCELMGVEPEEAHWPAVIRRVRENYKGPITYNTNQFRSGQPFLREWYKSLDLLGISFYTGTSKPNPTADDIAEALVPVAEAIEKEVVGPLGLPLFFAECGARSVAGGAEQPWAYANSGAYDGEVQANYLRGVIKAFTPREWWRGLMWWKWDEQQKRPQYNQPGGDAGFTIYGKPAAGVFTEWCATGDSRE